MATMEIWAPNAHSLELRSGDQSIAMQRGERGWWQVDAPFIEHGVDYSVYVDAQGPLPDPRSPWQPQGVHGPSRWVDHSRFEWTDPRWQAPPLSSALVYELHIGTFTPLGTFDSAVEKLDYLVDLGITHIELMPVAEFPGVRGWGYDGVDLFAPHHAYGGPEGLKRLVDACHGRGLAVILDVVYNHLGPAGNYLSRFGPYFTDRYSTPWGDAVNVDGKGSDEVRRFFIDNALMWLRDYHMDGLRLDAIHAISDRSAVHFFEQMAAEVQQLQAQSGRHFVLIAESDLNDPRVIRSRDAGGYGLDAQWNDDFHHALHSTLTGEGGGYYQDFGELADIANTLKNGFAYDGCYSTYRGRVHGRPAADVSGACFVTYLQNHDQVGNRAIGDRTSHLLTVGQLKVGAALLMTSPFVPMLFQGEEWGASTPFVYFTDHQEPELAEAIKNGRRSEFAAFGWDPDQIPDPQTEQTFESSKLNWNEQREGHHRQLFQWHQSLAKLRSQLPELRDGAMAQVSVQFDQARQWLCLQRGRVVVVCNLAEYRQMVPYSGAAHGAILLASEEESTLNGEGVAMPAQAVVILRVARTKGQSAS